MRVTREQRRWLTKAVNGVLRDAFRGNQWPTEQIVASLLSMIEPERASYVERFAAKQRHVIWSTKSTVVSGHQGYVLDRLTDKEVHRCDHKHHTEAAALACVMPRESRLTRDAMAGRI